MNNEPTAVLTHSPQLAVQAPLPAAGVPAKARVPAAAAEARFPAAARDLRVDVQSTAPLVVHVSGEIDIAAAPRLRERPTGRDTPGGHNSPSTSAA